MMDILKDILQFFMKKKRLWLLPVILVLLLMGILIMITASSAITPFIYTIF